MRAKETVECLAYAGALGHMWVVTRVWKGKESVYAECGTPGSAFRAWKELSDSTARIFHNIGRGRWKQVRPTAAAIS